MCIEPEAIDRFGRVLRYFLVGLVDQAIQVRVVSTDPRIEKYALGPVQTVLYERPTWPFTARRTDQLLDKLSSHPPMVVLATSNSSYRIAATVASTFDADLVTQVTSLSDCQTLAAWQEPYIAKYVALTKSLATALTEQVSIPADRIELIRPGVLSSKEATCFTDPSRTPAVVCISPFDRESGLDLLVEAVHKLVQRGRNLSVFLIGEGPMETTVRRMIREMDLSHHITLTGSLGTINQAVASADLFVSPSVDHAFYDDTLLAMGSGTAIIAMPNPIYDHLISGETAYICQEPNVHALIESMDTLLSDHELSRKIAVDGLEYTRKHHAISTMAEQMASLFRELAMARATFPIKE